MFDHQQIMHNTAPFFSLVGHPLKFRLYLLKNLPSAFFSGLKVVKATDDECMVSVPYRWFTQNPFRSTYFACLAMAAELSTGVLAMANIYGRRPPVSMLVGGMESRFFKKAKGITFFHCKDGQLVADAIGKAIATQEGQEVRVHTTGTTAAGEVVAEFWFTWSFKTK